jgi:hypothetical protein
MGDEGQQCQDAKDDNAISKGEGWAFSKRFRLWQLLHAQVLTSIQL